MDDSDAREQAVQRSRGDDRQPSLTSTAKATSVPFADRARLAWSVLGAGVARLPILLVMGEHGSLFLPSIGGSVIFVFALTDSPAAQPRALCVGHLASAAIGVACLRLLGPGLVSMLTAVLASMIFMVLTRTVHPPAGANPLLIIHAGAGWSALLAPIGVSLAILGAVAVVWSRLRPGVVYPVSRMACPPPKPPPV